MNSLAILLLLVSPLFAEDVPVRILEPQREQEARAEIEAATQRAEKRRLTGDEAGVTYEQVLNDPDNADLNYRYARVQVRQGKLSGAASTLERVLNIKPEMSKARLLYAIVLLRVDNLSEAEREFKILEAGDISHELRAELNKYLRLIRKRTQKTRLTTTLGAGMDFNGNMNSAPASGHRLLVDLPITLDAASTRQSDFAKIMLANAGVVHDFGMSGHQLSGTVGYYRAEQTNIKTLNLQSYSVGIGGRHRSSLGDFLPSFSFDHLRLAQTTYLRSREFRLRYERKAGERFDVFAHSSYARHVYNRTEIVPLGDQRTGDKIAGGGGVGMILGRSRISVGYSHTALGAAEAFNAYRRDSFTLDDIFILGRGQFLLFSATANLDRYLEADTAISATRRNDSNYRFRGTYGLPLGLFAKFLDDAIWTFSYEYYHALSNITNYAYTNNRISTMFTYKWNVGL